MSLRLYLLMGLKYLEMSTRTRLLCKGLNDKDEPKEDIELGKNENNGAKHVNAIWIQIM